MVRFLIKVWQSYEKLLSIFTPGLKIVKRINFIVGNAEEKDLRKRCGEGAARNELSACVPIIRQTAREERPATGVREGNRREG